MGPFSSWRASERTDGCSSIRGRRISIGLTSPQLLYHLISNQSGLPHVLLAATHLLAKPLRDSPCFLYCAVTCIMV